MHPVKGTRLRLKVPIPLNRLGCDNDVGAELISTGIALYHTEERDKTIFWVQDEDGIVFPIYLSEVELVNGYH